MKEKLASRERKLSGDLIQDYPKPIRHSFMHHQKLGPRAEYRQEVNERVRNSATLAEKFPDLKSLTVALAYFSQEGHSKSSDIRYTVNLLNAKSLFRFDCPNHECVGGDFDLSAELATAVAARRTTASGVVTCQGWRSKATIGKMSCLNVLRFTLRLGY